jgi:hypothetical protein
VCLSGSLHYTTLHYYTSHSAYPAPSNALAMLPVHLGVDFMELFHACAAAMCLEGGGVHFAVAFYLLVEFAFYGIVCVCVYVCVFFARVELNVAIYLIVCEGLTCHTHSRSNLISYILTHTHSFSLSHTLTHTLTLSLSLSRPHTFTFTHTHTQTHTTHSLTLSHTLTLTLTQASSDCAFSEPNSAYSYKPRTKNGVYDHTHV